MCSTCNYKNYIKAEQVINGKTVEFLKADELFLNIHCDVKGKNYKIGGFTIYYCPTCGRKLF